MLHRDYPYMSLDEKMLENENLCLIYQGRLYTDGPVIPLIAELLEMQNKHAGSQNILDIEVIETDDGIDLLFNYAAHMYKPESIERYSQIFIRILHDALRRMNANA